MNFQSKLSMLTLEGISCHRRQDEIVRSGRIQARCRLLYLVGQLRPGGLERQLYYLLQAMDRKRYLPAVVVWNFKEDDTYVRQIQELDVQVLALPQTCGGVSKLLAFCRLVKELSPEVIHSYSFYTNFAAFWGGIFRRIVTVGSLRSDFIREKKNAGLVLGRLSARWPKTHISNNTMATHNIRKARSIFVPKELIVVRNGLDLQKFKYVQLPKYPKSRILAVGSLLPVKRWDRLIEVAAALMLHGYDFLVRIVGDGPLRSSLGKQVEKLGLNEYVVFLGHRDDIPDLLADSSFLAHTSDSEGCPNVILEAMACGRAVVATGVGDVPYLLDNGNTGYVVNRHDRVVLSDRMATLIKNHELCRRMGEAGRAKAEKEFGLVRLVSETFLAYAAAGWKD